MTRRGFDHFALAVHDLDGARRLYERLGFTLTPPAEHPFGTGNSLVQLQTTYLELVTVLDPERIPPSEPHRFSFGAYIRHFLRQREGFAVLALKSDGDVRADQTEFATAGLHTYEPFDFERTATLPDGSEARVAFSLAFLTDPGMPQVAFMTCQHHTPERVWQPQYQTHPNGAQAVTEVVMVARQPAALRDLFATLHGADALQQGEQSLTVQTAQGRIAILTPAAFGERFGGAQVPGAPDTPYLAACRVGVTNLDGTEAVLRERNAPLHSHGDTLRIAPQDAFGVLLEFAEEG